ncbi:MAG: DUF1592 domain-containing protein [Verrucomicrobiaceae bacterium]|nr:DUF1592 domain-containing protein [Verrucomicrobiaceae bacterium]
MNRPLFLLLLHISAAGAVEKTDSRVTAFMQTYCVRCHGPKKQKGDFRVDALKVSETTAEAENWRLVLDSLNAGEMPPEDEKQPEAAALEQVTAWIQGELKRAALALGGQKGEVVLRRLNRFEYENTIEDLFDVHGDYAIAFPEDAKSGGFDNNGAALMLSAEQIEQYLRAADFVLGRAIVTQPRPETKKVVFTLKDIEEHRKAREEERAKRSKGGNDSGYTDTPAEKKRKEREKATGNYGEPFFPSWGEDMLIPVMYKKPDTKDFFRVKAPGWYRFKTVAYAVRNEGRVMRLEVHHGSDNKEEPQTIAGVTQLTDQTPREIEYRVYLQPNQRVEIAMLDGKNWLPGSRILEDKSPAIAIRSIEMEGPLIDEWPPRGHRTLFGEVDASTLTDDAVPALLKRLAPRLFRRPVEDGTLAEFTAFYQEQRRSQPALEAYRLTVKAMLASPLFLYHYEPAQKVDDYALANRLSYFLWRSAPDEGLLVPAARNELSQPAELKRQTARMLADERSRRFLRDFTRQWLQIWKVGEMKPDQNLYPEYDEELEHAMAQETELFVRELLVGDLSLANLIDSDWTMLNDRLARHYGIDGVSGNEFRKVKLDRAKTVRGGLLTHASILSITSNGTTTSPVVRGVWLLDHLLGTPAPPPPPDVPPIEPDIRGASTINEQLAKHRSISQCAACHAKIDPYGIALENFDVTGGWRTNYRALIPQKNRPRPVLGDGRPVNPVDTAPKLGSFAGFQEFRGLLKKNEHLVFANVAEKLAVYALGRAMTFADRDDLAEIVRTTRANGGGLRTMVEAVVMSPVFRRP